MAHVGAGQPCRDRDGLIYFYTPSAAEQAANLETLLDEMAADEIVCVGMYDDGIADGNLTRCSAISGCGRLGCRSTGVARYDPMRDPDR